MSRRDAFKTVKQHRNFARAYAEGMPLKHALIQAGYSPAQAKKGWVTVNKSKGLRNALAERGRLLCELGRINTFDQELLVRGRLVWNTIFGVDRGVVSTKALGGEKRLSMWRPDIQQEAIVLHVPTTVQDFDVKASADEEQGCLPPRGNSQLV